MPLKLVCARCGSRNAADSDSCLKCGRPLRPGRELTADELLERKTAVVWEPTWEEYRRLEALSERVSRDAKWTGIASLFGFEESPTLGGFLAVGYFLNRKNAGQLRLMAAEYRNLLLLKNDPRNNSYHRELHRFRTKWSELSQASAGRT
jgi:ribosomal protein L40E